MLLNIALVKDVAALCALMDDDIAAVLCDKMGIRRADLDELIQFLEADEAISSFASKIMIEVIDGGEYGEWETGDRVSLYMTMKLRGEDGSEKEFSTEQVFEVIARVNGEEVYVCANNTEIIYRCPNELFVVAGEN